jgi:hypothetical protein
MTVNTDGSVKGSNSWDQNKKCPPIIEWDIKRTRVAQEESHTQQNHNQSCHPGTAMAGNPQCGATGCPALSSSFNSAERIVARRLIVHISSFEIFSAPMIFQMDKKLPYL